MAKPEYVISIATALKRLRFVNSREACSSAFCIGRSFTAEPVTETKS